MSADLALIRAAAAAGDADAAAWLRGEGSIEIAEGDRPGEYVSAFVRFDELRTGTRAAAWSRAVLVRDAYTCQDCGQVGGRLQAHHVIPWAEDRGQRFAIDNGVTLCVPCHAERHPGIRGLVLNSRSARW
jgi:5-methylcytosine-specific restriction endonuclease McrA